MPSVLIQNGHLLDPSQNLDRIGNLRLVDGRIAGVEQVDAPVGTVDEVIDATGKLVAPGLIDIGTELREPGFEDDETVASGAAAALAAAALGADRRDRAVVRRVGLPRARSASAAQDAAVR